MARKHPAITRARWGSADAEPMEPEMPPNPGVTPEDPRLSTKESER